MSHKLEIKHRNIYLDDFYLRGVNSYKLTKENHSDQASLKLVMSILDPHLELNEDRVPKKKSINTSKHTFEIDDRELFLDSFKLLGVIDYEVTSSAMDKSAELVINMVVLDVKVVCGKSGNGNRN